MQSYYIAKYIHSIIPLFPAFGSSAVSSSSSPSPNPAVSRNALLNMSAVVLLVSYSYGKLRSIRPHNTRRFQCVDSVILVAILILKNRMAGRIDSTGIEQLDDYAYGTHVESDAVDWLTDPYEECAAADAPAPRSTTTHITTSMSSRSSDSEHVRIVGLRSDLRNLCGIATALWAEWTALGRSPFSESTIANDGWVAASAILVLSYFFL
eukprot:ANDGO_00898.mRNA.1 hypothetical protein